MGRILTLLLGALSCILPASSLANDFDGTRYEAELLNAAEDISEANWRGALRGLDSITDRFPESRIAHLLRAQLLGHMAGQPAALAYSDTSGLTTISEALQEEIKLRWQHRQAVSLQRETLIPEKLLQASSASAHLLYVDLPAARLYVFKNDDQRLKPVLSFYVTIGRKGFGKEKEGDLKTPVGIYRLTGYIPGARLHERYGFGALTTNYPNALDKHLDRTGYGIWIHGTEPGWVNRGPKASDGCITLSNSDFEILVTQFELGPNTPIVIDDEPRWLTPQSISELRNGLLPSINGDPVTGTSAPLDSSIGWSLHAEQLQPLGFDEIFFYPDRHAQLVTKRLAKSDTRGLITIEEYWAKNQAGRWELAFKIPSS